MVQGIGETRIKKKKKGLTAEKDYIAEAYLQGGKAIGHIIKRKNLSKKQKNNHKN